MSEARIAVVRAKWQRQQEEEALLARAHQGDEDAFWELIERRYRSLHRVAPLRLRDHHEVESVLVEAVRRVKRRLPRLRSRRAFVKALWHELAPLLGAQLQRQQRGQAAGAGLVTSAPTGRGNESGASE